MHVDGSPGVLTGGEEGGPVASVEGGQPEVGGDLGEAHGMTAPFGVTTHLVGGQPGVPQRDDDEGDKGPV